MSVARAALPSRCALAALLFSGGALLGCVDNERSIFIRGVAQQTRSGDSCSADASSSQLLSRGRLDVALTERYAMAVVVGNQMIARGERLQLTSEATRAFIQRAEVRWSTLDEREIAAFSTPTTAVIDPSSDGVSARYGVAMVEALNGNALQALRDGLSAGESRDYVLHVRLHGETQGGNNLKTAEYALPISVCSGCLVSFPAPDASSGAVQCESFTEPSPCAIGQDGPVACGLCLGNPVCAPPAPSGAP